MHRKLKDIDFVIVDVETTGLSPQMGDRIVEIAAIKFKDKKEINKFYSFINPQRSISEAAYQVNHISADMLKDAPLSHEVLPKFIDFIQDSCVAGYNVGFDMSFINNELALLGKEIPQDIPIVDILSMARKLLPGLSRYALWFVAGHLGISSLQEHRAYSDTKLTKDVFLRLRDILEKKGIDNLLNLQSLFGLDSDLTARLNEQKLIAIQEAIDLDVKLKIRYSSSGGLEVTEREVSPKQIQQQKGKNFLMGFCHLRNEERSFRIDRILHLEIL